MVDQISQLVLPMETVQIMIFEQEQLLTCYQCHQGKEENRESDECQGKTLEVEDLNSSCSRVHHNSSDAIGQREIRK